MLQLTPKNIFYSGKALSAIVFSLLLRFVIGFSGIEMRVTH